MKLSVAYHCHDCQEIFERAPRRLSTVRLSRDFFALLASQIGSGTGSLV